jgi:hypothetical protein
MESRSTSKLETLGERYRRGLQECGSTIFWISVFGIAILHFLSPDILPSFMAGVANFYVTLFFGSILLVACLAGGVVLAGILNKGIGLFLTYVLRLQPPFDALSHHATVGWKRESIKGWKKLLHDHRRHGHGIQMNWEATFRVLSMLLIALACASTSFALLKLVLDGLTGDFFVIFDLKFALIYTVMVATIFSTGFVASVIFWRLIKYVLFEGTQALAYLSTVSCFAWGAAVAATTRISMV